MSSVALQETANYKDYLELCKPRVVMLMLLTSLVGMCLTPVAPSFFILVFGNLGIALVASAAAVMNHIADQHIDRIMRRTQSRPIAQGKISVKQSLWFASIIGFIGLGILYFFINTLTASLTFLSLIGYAVFYTLYLKHATPQNIVIGGIAGAAPPLLGWTAVTGSISAQALLLVLIIYVWTPPHFWSLAIYRLEDYAKANIPMLPHTHGVEFTKLHIVLYTVLLACVTTLPYIIQMSGMIYFVGASIANAIFLYYAIQLYRKDERKIAINTFWYSIYYLGIIFVFLLMDHYWYLKL